MTIEHIEPPKARVPTDGEATGYGATFWRDLGAWVIYWMPGAIPLGVTAESRDACDFVLSALRANVEKSRPDEAGQE